MIIKENPWQLISDKKVYENPWIQVNHHEVLDPSGQPGIYGKIHFKNIAVGVVPIDDQENTWIVGQYRYPLGRYSWEIPEGGCPINTDPLITAKRELKEETGIIAQEWNQIMSVDVSNSVTDEVGIIYVATGLTFESQELESTEDITVRSLPFDELFSMVMEGKVTDSLSILAVLKARALQLA